MSLMLVGLEVRGGVVGMAVWKGVGLEKKGLGMKSSMVMVMRNGKIQIQMPLTMTILKSPKGSKDLKRHLDIPRLEPRKSIVSCKDNYTREKPILPLGMKVRLRKLELGIREVRRMSWVWVIEGGDGFSWLNEEDIYRSGFCVDNGKLWLKNKVVGRKTKACLPTSSVQSSFLHLEL
jgi:hypothetical protein